MDQLMKNLDGVNNSLTEKKGKKKKKICMIVD
jgi:hypothetical protein